MRTALLALIATPTALAPIAAPVAMAQTAAPADAAPVLSPEEQALADWEAYRRTMRGEGEDFEAAPPALDPMERRGLYQRLTALDEKQRLAIDMLAQETYETRLTDWQRAALQEDARVFYKTLSPADRLVMAERRRAEFRTLSQGERARWRRTEGPSYLGLTDAQRDIFRLAAYEALSTMSPDDQQARFSAADVLLKARAAEKRQAASGVLAPLSVEAELDKTTMSPEERLRFQAMTPDQQRAYLEQVRPGQPAAQ